MSDAPVAPPRLTPNRVRTLTAEALKLDVGEPVQPLPAAPEMDEELTGIDPALLEPLDETDPTLIRTLDLLETFGGVIFVGPPGTSKSWYALRIARHLTGGMPERLRLVQFHPSYQYEDFVEGYVPATDAAGKADGFRLADKHLLEVAKHALIDPEPHVVVIDELSRGEPGRIFGEALTYVEKTKRGIPFRLASGTEIRLPRNLVFLATMNPQDRGVDEVDAAFERRFAKIALDPDDVLLSGFLTSSGMPEELRKRVIGFFRAVNSWTDDNPLAALGHTFFVGINGEEGLRRLWDHQLRFLFEKAFRIDREGLRRVQRLWDGVLQPVGDEPAPEEESTPSSEPDEAE